MLYGTDVLTNGRLQSKVVAAKRLLWHGRKNDCLATLEVLRRDAGWGGAQNPLGRVIRYLRACASPLVNYAARRRKRRPISSTGAESAVDFVIGQRMKRNGHMRWTPVDANAILQVRCAVLSGQDSLSSTASSASTPIQELLPQFSLLDLAGRCHWQRLDELDLLGNLVAGDQGAAMRDHIIARESR